MLKISDIANVLGVSQTTVYKKARGKLKEKLEPLTKKIDGILWFDSATVEIFRAAITTASTDTTVMITPAPEDKISPEISARLGGMEQAMLSMAAQMKIVIEENRALREGMSRLFTRLEAPPLLPEPMKIVKPWKPAQVQASARPWYERFWLQMFSPEALRVTVE